jgi:hypothetical protein
MQFTTDVVLPISPPGLPDSSWRNIPKLGNIYKKHKIYQITIKCTKWPEYTKWPKIIPTIFTPKVIKISIFGTKIYHLATLLSCKVRLFTAPYPALSRVARFYFVHDTKTIKNVPNEHKM